MALVVKQNDQMKKDFKARQTLQAPFQPAATTFDEKRRRYLVWNAVGSIICTEYSHTNSRIEIRFANVGGKNKQVGEPLASVLPLSQNHNLMHPLTQILTQPITTLRHKTSNTRYVVLFPPILSNPMYLVFTHSLISTGSVHSLLQHYDTPSNPIYLVFTHSLILTDCVSRQHGLFHGGPILRR